MDSITHILVGGMVGEVFAGRKMGLRAMAAGAAFNSYPDIDFVASFFLDTVDDIIAHRGLTHSIFFGLLSTPVLAYIFYRYFRRTGMSYKRWLWFIGAEIMLHLFLDAFNAYGTGWFEPFYSARVSFNTIYVADPLFSLPPLLAFFALVFLPKNHRYRIGFIRFGLGWVAVYLSLSVISKLLVFDKVKDIAHLKGITYNRYFTTPTPMNTAYWFVVLENDSGYNIGYRSVFDKGEDMHFEFFPRNEHLLDDFEDTVSIKKLMKFSQGFYVVQNWNDTLVFSDLRFGQMAGWHNPKARFAFYYYLDLKDQNDLVIQRGRFQNWDKAAGKSLINGILGRRKLVPVNSEEGK